MSYGAIGICCILIDYSPMTCSIRNFLARNGNYYAPTYLKLYDAAVRNHLPPGVRKMAKKRSANQGPEPVSNDVEFDNEYEWVHAVWKGKGLLQGNCDYSLIFFKVGYNRTRADRKIRNSLAPATPAKNQSVHIAEKSFKIECGCCFNDECSFVCPASQGHGSVFIFVWT